MSVIITPDITIKAYCTGYFPMADSDGKIYWHCPDFRAIFPLEKIKMPRSLRKAIKNEQFEFKVNQNFHSVINLCAVRDATWISEEIIYIYSVLHNMGYCHSVETYKDKELVGGLYGVAIGGAFFGESMFNLVPEASKAAFYYLVERLKSHGFVLLDSQYLNHHTAMLGAVEIPRNNYLRILRQAIRFNCEF